MRKSQYFLYSGITTWIFEELCDELRKGIESSLERRGLKGVENSEFRAIVIGETTAGPLFTKYSAFISTELESRMARLNNCGIQIERTPIDPSMILKKLQMELRKIISARNNLVHNSWSPQLLSDERPTVRAFSNKISEKGSSIKLSELEESDFRKFIKDCETLKHTINHLNFCLDTGSSPNTYFEIMNDTILPANNIEMENLSILTEMQEQIEKLA